MNGLVRALVREEQRWRCETAPSSSGSGDVIVEVEALLIPSERANSRTTAVLEGFWIGHSPGDEQGRRLGGWGPLASRIVCRRDAVSSLPVELSIPEALLLLPLAAVNDALMPFAHVSGATLVGDDLIASVVGVLLDVQGARSINAGGGQLPELLIDTTAEPATWGPAISGVAHEGHVLLLLPERDAPADFNFYQGVHRRSLSVSAARWSRAAAATSDLPEAGVVKRVITVLEGEERIQPLHLGEQMTSDSWLLFEWAG